MTKDIITTERLILRPVGAPDAEAICALIDNYKIAVMLARVPYPYRIEDAHRFIAWAKDQPADETVLALCLKDKAQTFIGVCSYERRKDHDDFGFEKSKVMNVIDSNMERDSREKPVPTFSHPALGEPELGYWLGEPYWGKAYMSEAVKAVIAQAFTVAGHERLVSGCRLQNLASRRVLEKAGFEHTGLGEIDSLVLKTKVPGHRFSLTRERWEGLTR